MDYTTRIVRSVEGLSQEEALITLQEHPEFRAGTRIASLQDQDGRWVAKLLEPKFANESLEEGLDKLSEGDEDKAADDMPPFAKKEHEEHEESETPEEEHEEHESPEEEKEEHKDGKDKKIQELEKKIDKLLDALGLSEDEEVAEGPVADGAVPPPPAGEMVPPAPKAPKAPADKGPELPPGSGAKLKPGEVPNKPGVTPIGSPAFASVKQANPTMNPPVPASGTATAPTPPSSAAASCTKCGGAGCDQCRMAQGASGPQAPHMPGAATPGTVSSFVASRLDSDRDISIRQAKISLENEFASRGFRVARIKRDGDYLRALMTRNDS